MLNKPKYNFFKNTVYALEGLKDAFLNESSFRLQDLAFLIFTVLIIYLPIEYKFKAILFISLFLNIIAEIINSAIERVVDLCTKEIHPLAKNAKDLGATVVFLSILTTVIIWLIVLLFAFKII